MGGRRILSPMAKNYAPQYIGGRSFLAQGLSERPHHRIRLLLLVRQLHRHPRPIDLRKLDVVGIDAAHLRVDPFHRRHPDVALLIVLQRGVPPVPQQDAGALLQVIRGHRDSPLGVLPGRRSASRLPYLTPDP